MRLKSKIPQVQRTLGSSTTKTTSTGRKSVDVILAGKQRFWPKSASIFMSHAPPSWPASCPTGQMRLPASRMTWGMGCSCLSVGYLVLVVMPGDLPPLYYFPFHPLRLFCSATAGVHIFCLIEVVKVVVKVSPKSV